MQRRRRHIRKRLERRDESRQHSVSAFLEQHELEFLRNDLDRDGGLFDKAVHAQDDASALSFELHGLTVGSLDFLRRVEARQHPADRRHFVGAATRIDRSRDDQPVDRPCHRHVVEPQSLRALLCLSRFLHHVELVGAAGLARDRIGDAKAEPTVRKGEDLVRRRRCLVPSGVGHDDDLELESLRSVDRQQANRVASLLLGDGLELARADRLLVADEPHEPFDIRPAELFVRPREPGELAEIRVTAPAVPTREHGQVVVVLREDPLAQALEREARERSGQPFVPLAERAQQLSVALGERLGELTLERHEERALRRGAPQQHERVVRDAHKRGREHAHERLVVVAIAQQTQVREQVDDLLLTEVAAPGPAVGGDA